jgi:hypothetical protein
LSARAVAAASAISAGSATSAGAGRGLGEPRGDVRGDIEPASSEKAAIIDVMLSSSGAAAAGAGASTRRRCSDASQLARTCRCQSRFAARASSGEEGRATIERSSSAAITLRRCKFVADSRRFSSSHCALRAESGLVRSSASVGVGSSCERRRRRRASSSFSLRRASSHASFSKRRFSSEASIVDQQHVDVCEHVSSPPVRRGWRSTARGRRKSCSAML